MDRYYKEIDGKVVFYKNGTPVSYNGRTYLNPKEEHILAAGWLKYVKPEPAPEERTLEQAITAKVNQIYNYDSSSYVNKCYIQVSASTYEYWADKNTRTSLREAVRAYVNTGHTDYTLDLREESISLTISCTDLLDMLDRLEVYAVECYNVTTQHVYAVKALLNIDDVDNYDFRTGYPSVITFNVNEQ